MLRLSVNVNAVLTFRRIIIIRFFRAEEGAGFAALVIAWRLHGDELTVYSVAKSWQFTPIPISVYLNIHRPFNSFQLRRQLFIIQLRMRFVHRRLNDAINSQLDREGN